MNNRMMELCRYVVPSVASMAVAFLYVLVDGIFVGRGIGAHALAAVNIVLPFNVMVMAVASMLVAGGSSVFAIRAGRGDAAGANEAFLAGAAMILVVSTALSALGVCLPWHIARWSGATDGLVEMAAVYTRYYCLFTPVFMGSVFLAQFIRNDGAPVLAFWGMTVGAAANIVFDWMFVFPLQMGVKGAAIASGLGQVLSLGILAMHFVRRRGILRLGRCRCTWGGMVKIIKRGLPEMISQLGHPVTVFFYNLVVIRMLGEMGVAALSIVLCVASVLVNGIFAGVSQGVQPLLGRNFGQENPAGVQYYYRMAMAINLSVAAAAWLVCGLCGRALVAVFITNEALIQSTVPALRIYAVSFGFSAANVVLTTYYFSTKQTGRAVVLAAARSLVFNSLFILTLAYAAGPSAIWFAIAMAEASALAVGLWLKYRQAHAGGRGIAIPLPLQYGRAQCSSLMSCFQSLASPEND